MTNPNARQIPPATPSKRVASIVNGVVKNVVVMPLDAVLDPLTEIESATARIGDSFAGGVFTRAAPVPPEVVSKLQLIRALRIKGKWGQTKAAIASLSIDDKEDWEAAFQIKRADPLVATLGAAINPPLTEAELDATFIAAETL